MNELTNEKTMTIKEIAEVLNLDVRTIQLKAKELFPDKIKERETSYFNQIEVTEIKKGCEKKFAATTENEKTMSIKELADILQVTERFIQLKTKELYPDLVKNGKTTYLNAEQVAYLKIQIEKNPHLERSFEVKNDTEMALKLFEAGQYFKDKYEELKKENEILKKDAEIMKPKEIAFETFINADGFKSMNEAGKLLGIGRNKLFQLLRQKNILMKNNLPYQKYIDLNYFIVKNTVNNNINFSTPLLTPDGLYFVEKIIKD